MIRASLHYCKRQCRDLVELFLLPGFCALLPLSITDRAVGLFARLPFLYRQQVRRDDPHLPGRRWTGPEMRERRRLVLIDYRDNYLFAFGRFGRYTERYCDLHGQWPSQGGFIGLGLHWGPGMTVVQSMRNAGLRPRLVYRAELATQAVGMSVARRFQRWHIRLLLKMCDNEAIPVGGSLKRIRESLARGDVPILAPDVPCEDDWQGHRVRVGEHAVQLVAGTVKLLANDAIPFVIYRSWPQADWRRRVVEANTLSVSNDRDEIARMLAEKLLDGIYARPSLYFLWPHANLVIRWPEDQSAEAASSTG